MLITLLFSPLVISDLKLIFHLTNFLFGFLDVTHVLQSYLPADGADVVEVVVDDDVFPSV